MNNLTFKIIVAFVTFVAGVAIATVAFIRHSPTVIQESQYSVPSDNRETNQSVEALSSNGSDGTESVPTGPYEIKRYIDEHGSINVEALWRRLGIEAQLQTVYSRLGIEPLNEESSFDDCNNCVAEIFNANVDGEPDNEVLLKLYQRWGYCRFLIFKRTNHGEPTTWRLLGYADHDFARYYMPEHRIEILGGKRFLVVKAQGISGTGVSLAYNRWYEVDNRGVREVLSLPAEGHECFDMRSLCREFESRVVSRTNNQGIDTVQVIFTVSYSGNYFLVNENRDDDLHFFAQRQTGTFTRASNLSAYILDAQRSDITEEEIRSVYNVDSLGSEDFLRFNINNLMRIATGRRSKHKEWLRRYLDDCEETPERASLLQALGR